MIRLIDADELKKTLKEAHINMKLTFDIATFNCVMNIIDNAPTADDWQKFSDELWKNAYERGKADRPQGEWITFSTNRLMMQCPECTAFLSRTRSDIFKDSVGEMNFCPNCGADMRGEKSNE